MSQLIAKQVTKKNMQKGSIQPTSPELEINSQIFEKFRTWLSLKSEILPPGVAGQHNKLARQLYFTKESQFRKLSLAVLDNTTS